MSKRQKKKKSYNDFIHKSPTKTPLLPKTENQAAYIKALQQDAQVIVLGPAGTGKTFIAATYAADLYDLGQIDQIILTRPNIAAGKSLGFFKGTLEEKMSPWLAPVVDVIEKRLGKGKYETGVKNGNIQVIPFETMRGRSFEDAFVILDEAQNTSPHEIKMFLTRVGENCHVVMNGDIQQSDLDRTSGLSKAIMMAKKYLLPVSIIEFGIEDIVRSELCKLWIKAWIKEETKP